MKSKEVTEYINRSADFAKPILNHLRELIHAACPEAEEKMRWRMPFFDYKGDMLCHMAAFKKHAALGFWKSALMKDPALRDPITRSDAMGNLGKLASLKDLPSDKKMVAYIQEAMHLNELGVKLPARRKKETD